MKPTKEKKPLIHRTPDSPGALEVDFPRTSQQGIPKSPTPTPIITSNLTRVAMLPWGDMRLEYERLGLTQPQIADKYAVSRATVIRRSQAEGWINPRRGILKPRKRKKSATGEQSNGFGDNDNQQGRSYPQNELLDEAGNPSLMQLSCVNGQQDRTSLEVSQAIETLLLAGVKMLEPPKTWRELATAYQVYRQSTGLDKAESGSQIKTLIQVNAGIRRATRAARSSEVQDAVIETEDAGGE